MCVYIGAWLKTRAKQCGLRSDCADIFFFFRVLFPLPSYTFSWFLYMAEIKKKCFLVSIVIYFLDLPVEVRQRRHMQQSDQGPTARPVVLQIQCPNHAGAGSDQTHTVPTPSGWFTFYGFANGYGGFSVDAVCR